MRIKSKHGYTLLEIAVVIVILGASASFAFVSYGDYMRRLRSQEGRQILISLFGAQIERRREQGTFFAGNLVAINNTAVSLLNVSFTQPFRNFANLSAVNGTNLCGFPIVGSIDAIDGAYSLSITDQGNIICSQGGVCGTPLCTRIQ